MEWQNLNTQECPHCSRKIEDRGGEMRCTKCSFHIDYKRYHSIRAARNRDKPTQPMYWQNLRKGRCPLCSDLMRDTIGKYQISRCINLECPFKIRDDELEKMMEDETHPINKYKDDPIPAKER